MNKQILFPVDFNAGVQLADYANLFAHVDKKSFVGFFLRDFNKVARQKISEAQKITLQHDLQKEADQLSVDFDVLKNTTTNNLLLNQCRFSDLLIVNPLTEENVQQLNNVFPDHFFELVACPVFLTEDVTRPFEEILVLFDYDHSGLVALKSFLSFFGKVSREKKLTLLTVSPDDAPEIHLEKYLVSYLQKFFNDVGIAPLRKENLLEQVISHASRLPRPVLVLGHSAIQLLNNHDLARQLTHHQTAVFYSNI
ncbi:MAG: hypothetical protein KF775_07125 [Cyclobacteriaceae bacterium]|nr:hypothetical protein [Cyclobacteriaceae bacterium]